MGDVTKIQWTDHTFNPWIGCAKVAPGCEHCYAEADMDKKRGRVKWGPHGTRSITSVENWKKPLAWNRQAEADGTRHRVFCASLADVFEAWGDPIYQGDDVLLKPYLDSENYRAMWDAADPEIWHKDPQGWQLVELHDVRRELFRLIDATPWLDWQLLTKRPENIRKMWPPNYLADTEHRQYGRSNVWLGTSISDQSTADKAIPALLRCRDLSPVLFLSAEPLLGPIDLTGQLVSSDGFVSALADGPIHVSDGGRGIDWIIVGGESGPNARPCHMEWIRSLVDQCRVIGHPCFVKQLGAWPLHHGDSGDARAVRRMNHAKGGDPAEWPEDLRVREFQKVTVQQ